MTQETKVTRADREALASDPIMQAFIGTIASTDAERAEAMKRHLLEDADEKLVEWLKVFKTTFRLASTEAADALLNEARKYSSGHLIGCNLDRHSYIPNGEGCTCGYASHVLRREAHLKGASHEQG